MALRSKKESIAIALIIVLLIVLYNYVTISSGGWFKHPDEQGSYIFANKLLENNLREISKEQANDQFTPAGFISYEGKSVPLKPALEYYTIASILLINKDLFFYVSAIVLIISTLLFYTSIKKITELDNKLLIPLLLFFYSTFLFVYWANFPYYNLAAALFFTSGVIIFHKSEAKINKIILASLLTAYSIMLRYEFLLIFVITLLILIISDIKRYKSILVLIIAVGLICTPILFFNNTIYGHYTATPYLYNTNNTEQGVSSTSSLLDRVYTRFFTQDLSLDFNRITHNFADWVVGTYYWIIPLFLCGVLILIGNPSRDKKLLFALLVSAIYFSYNTLGGYHWGENKDFVGTAYIRYLSFPLITLFIFSMFAIEKIKLKKLFIGFLIFIGITSSFLLLFSAPPDDLNSNVDNNLFFKELNEVVLRDNNQVVLTAFYGKYLTKKEVINIGPQYYKEDSSVTNQLMEHKTLISNFDKIVLFNDPRKEPIEEFNSFITSELKYKKNRIENVTFGTKSMEIVYYSKP